MKEATFFVEYFGEKAGDSIENPTVLDRFAEPVTELLYGTDAIVMLTFHSGERRDDGYVLKIDMSIQMRSHAWSVKSDESGEEPSAGKVLATIKEILGLGKFCFGRKAAASFESNKRGQLKVTNSAGQVQYFDPSVVKLYNRYRLHLSKFTEPLERNGIDSIRIGTGNDDETAVVFDKKDRPYLRCDKGSVVSENECDLFLEVVAPKLNGSAEGWRFSEGKGGYEFTATIEDTAFLEKVKSQDILFAYNTGIYAVVRMVQRKAERTKKDFVDDLGEPAVTERSIVKVLEVYDIQELF